MDHWTKDPKKIQWIENFNQDGLNLSTISFMNNKARLYTYKMEIYNVER